MDSFPRPDIAEGIFYEYLRYDDPISPELRERVVDGFPFLLAPLAQVKGISIGNQRLSSRQTSHGIFAAFRAFTSAADSISASVMELAAAAQQGAMNSLNSAALAARSIGDAGANFGKDLIGKKDVLTRQMFALSDTLLAIWSSRKSSDESIEMDPNDSDLHPVEVFQHRREPLGRAFGYPLSRWFSENYPAPDEIGPMKIHPTMSATRKAFLAFVHLYLLLLFIVSFPGSYTTRTKLVVRKTKLTKMMRDNSVSDSLTLSSNEKSDSSLDSRGSPPAAGDDFSPGMARRVRSRNRRVSKKGLLRRALGPSVSEDIQDELSTGSSNIRLKKKSLSYFL
jgi:hypothetical protein